MMGTSECPTKLSLLDLDFSIVGIKAGLNHCRKNITLAQLLFFGVLTPQVTLPKLRLQNRVQGAGWGYWQGNANNSARESYKTNHVSPENRDTSWAAEIHRTLS